MSSCGLNAIRTYTVPPVSLLDIAEQNGLRVMVGLAWEQHLAFLDDKKRARSIEERVGAAVRACAGHSAVLCYVIGNEIPATIVRWHGRRRIERYLERLYTAARAEDPGALVTYVNYPSTEYLELPFLDFVCFNVYLESQERFEAYIARLHNIAGDRPLVMTEMGLDSRRHGRDIQAHTLDWQIRTAFAAGCSGAFIFSWTDEWHRGGYDIGDWDFGLTDRSRRQKPALGSVRKALAEVPFPPYLPWPRFSVVVCSYNGERTIRDCLDGLLELDYPDYEVIVVDDGSTDRTATIAREYPFKVVSTSNCGLSSARNTGLEAASGEMVAYIDDDARPDREWLKYLAATFMSTTHAGVGGPNIAPPGDGPIADCVANSPGGPVHVLLSDHEAEHIPGCNMAFRKANLQAIGGFDQQFHAAGDDVDICWRLQQRGWTLGFNPAAMVWHHRRNSIRAYWKQQKGYGKAEALLRRKWPENYNAAGHISWSGRIYGKSIAEKLAWGFGRIYQGTWGSALFQSVYKPAPSLYASLPLMPEWYIIIAVIGSLYGLAALWTPLLLITFPLLCVAVAAPIAQAGFSAARASFARDLQSRIEVLKLRVLTAFLHLLQPLARLCGLLGTGLTPWPWRRALNFRLPWPRDFAIWSETWRSSREWLQSMEAALLSQHAVVVRGGDWDSWDLEVLGGMLGATRISMTIEEHGAGRQLVRFRCRAKCSAKGLVLTLLFASIAVCAAYDHGLLISAILGGVALLIAVGILEECATIDVPAAFETFWAHSRRAPLLSGKRLQSKDKILRQQTRVL
jgi:glycosyltransferase involved in cell wall biosynthesis